MTKPVNELIIELRNSLRQPRRVVFLSESTLPPQYYTTLYIYFRLVYDESTKTMKNSPGVQTRVPGFGHTDSIEYLDEDKLIKYMLPMVDALVSWGYERGTTVRAAPYDFRYGPGEFDCFSPLL